MKQDREVSRAQLYSVSPALSPHACNLIIHFGSLGRIAVAKQKSPARGGACKPTFPREPSNPWRSHSNCAAVVRVFHLSLLDSSIFADWRSLIRSTLFNSSAAAEFALHSQFPPDRKHRSGPAIGSCRRLSQTAHRDHAARYWPGSRPAEPPARAPLHVELVLKFGARRSPWRGRRCTPSLVPWPPGRATGRRRHRSNRRTACSELQPGKRARAKPVEWRTVQVRMPLQGMRSTEWVGRIEWNSF